MSDRTYIENACEQFRTLLLEQLERTERMAAGSAPKDFASMEQITIGIVGGDGIGPIIMEQAERLLRKVMAEELSAGKIVLKKIEGLTIENRMALGKAVPEDVLAEIKSCDVLLKGPTTTPKGGTLESANAVSYTHLDVYKRQVYGFLMEPRDAGYMPIKLPERSSYRTVEMAAPLMG